MSKKYSLISDPLFTVREGSALHSLSLPDVLSAISQGTSVNFHHLQVHQEPPWYDFLTTLITVILHTHDQDTLTAQAPSVWRAWLLDLSAGDEAPWCLVVDDPLKPAFMQPAATGKSPFRMSKKELITSPDDLDTLITSKNHDVKINRVVRPRAEHWIYALISLQTHQGFLGRGNYGIARMNGGFSNRPHITSAPSLDWSERIQRDTALLIAGRSEIISNYHYPASEGLTLLWLSPWDGKTSLSFNQLDPFFIEICRRIRFSEKSGVLVAFQTPTSCSRIKSPDGGVTGDPWTPIQEGDGKTLTVSGAGFHYRLTQALLLRHDFFTHGALKKPLKNDSLFIAKALVRGQGITEGFHQRILHIPQDAQENIQDEDLRQKLAVQSGLHVDDAGNLSKRALKPALCSLLQGGVEKLSLTDDRTQRWLSQFVDTIDSHFFDHLWSVIKDGEEIAQFKWRRWLFNTARNLLNDACDDAPIPVARHYRAISRSQALLYGVTRKIWPELFIEELAPVL